jgi:hypothetical protein
MDSDWHQGMAGGLSGSILRLVDDPAQIDCLRQMLRTFSHRCRNSLNGIKMSLYLLKREHPLPMLDCWDELERTYQAIECLFDRLQFIYRPLSMTMVQCPFGQFVAQHLPAWRSWFAANGRTLEIGPPAQEALGDFDPMHLGQGLDAFVAWRAERGHTAGTAHLSWAIEQGFFDINWTETAPSTDCAGQDSIVRASSELQSSDSVDPLALPVLARIVQAHGGQLEQARGPSFGIRLRWPQFRVSRHEE